MTTLFISDLHLCEQQPHLTDLFDYFIATYCTDIDALYILGDLFEVWIGDDYVTAHTQHIFQQLHSLTQSGLPTYVMPGNRDFLLGKQFSHVTGCVLLKDPSVIDLYGHPTLLKHGDDLCWADTKHLTFRRYSHNRLLQSIFLSLPIKWRNHMANKIRRVSQQHGQTIAMKIQDVSPEAIPAVTQQHHVDQLIHGHTHRPSIHYLAQPSHWIRHIVLSDWAQQGNMLRYYPNGKLSLDYFDLP